MTIPPVQPLSDETLAEDEADFDRNADSLPFDPPLAPLVDATTQEVDPDREQMVSDDDELPPLKLM